MGPLRPSRRRSWPTSGRQVRLAKAARLVPLSQHVNFLSALTMCRPNREFSKLGTIICPILTYIHKVLRVELQWWGAPKVKQRRFLYNTASADL